jgi:Mycothiol maleylpyruvate isomerase N-terminal domain
MSEDRSYIEENARELERMRALVDRSDDDTLRSPVNEYWTVAGVLGHIAFWDGRALALADKLERGLAQRSQHLFTAEDDEPGEVDWINDATRPLIHAVPPDQLARLALQIAEETDTRVADLPPEHMWPRDPDSPLNALRASHRAEHLDDIDAALGSAD